jgi:hypothetical protein
VFGFGALVLKRCETRGGTALVGTQKLRAVVRVDATVAVPGPTCHNA